MLLLTFDMHGSFDSLSHLDSLLFPTSMLTFALVSSMPGMSFFSCSPDRQRPLPWSNVLPALLLHPVAPHCNLTRASQFRRALVPETSFCISQRGKYPPHAIALIVPLSTHLRRLRKHSVVPPFLTLIDPCFDVNVSLSSWPEMTPCSFHVLKGRRHLADAVVTCFQITIFLVADHATFL